ncbi:MAG: selenocysteine-specific elongation factor [Acidobacteriota bacterium]|jgi:selenocysteine-specific elongation factor|nr:selenocysteine-specific elongation factor [Acidobacteriota bacterium]
MRSVIVGTAGHIDHGKTTLVRALTGVDADRLPEEKRRGITIDLGFAELDLGDVRVGFVDVPGHERFVKNMLAGAHGLDLVALVIAADEGVMPQTREHFDICCLLGVRAGLVVLTKADAVDEELLELVRAEAEELLAGSFLEGAPVVAVSARTGQGIEELKAALRTSAHGVPERSPDTLARLPVDRSFTMRGFGAVATGTLIAGEIKEGDELELLPGGVGVRVRGLQVHGTGVRKASAGQRTAVNLGGVETAGVKRGMVLAHAGRLTPTQIVDALITVLADAPRPLRTRQRVRVHHGTAEVLARVAALEESGEIAPGSVGLAQVRLESPIVALPGDRFILRTYSPQRTIAGGEVLDAHARKHRGRERTAARERLVALRDADRATRLAFFVESAGAMGLRRAEATARTGWRDDVLDAALAEALKRGSMFEVEGVLVGSEVVRSHVRAAIVAVEAHHKREPLSRGLARETLRERVFAHAAPELFRAALKTAGEEGSLVAERELVRAAAHSLELSPADAALRDCLEGIYRAAALEAPTLEEAFAGARREAGGRPEHLRKILRLLLDSGALVRVREDLLFHREALERLTAALSDYAVAHSPERLIDVAAFKELSGVSRKYAIPLLEYFDRERVTRRAGDRRVIL